MNVEQDLSKLLGILEKLLVGLISQRAILAGLLAEQPESKVAAIFGLVAEMADADEPGAGLRDAALMRSAWDELLTEACAFRDRLGGSTEQESGH